jgi:drug/metabolite transporter (DMT)-like permease
MGFSYLVALHASDNISLITALKALALPLTAIVGHLVLKERDNNTLLFAAIALGVVGVIVTAL